MGQWPENEVGRVICSCTSGSSSHSLIVSSKWCQNVAKQEDQPQGTNPRGPEYRLGAAMREKNKREGERTKKEIDPNGKMKVQCRKMQTLPQHRKICASDYANEKRGVKGWGFLQVKVPTGIIARQIGVHYKKMIRINATMSGVIQMERLAYEKQ